MTKLYTVLWISAALTIGLIGPIYIFFDEVLHEPPMAIQGFVR